MRRPIVVRASGLTVVFGLALLACLPLEGNEPGKHDDGPTFERDIVPIFKAYCWRCHGGEARIAGLDLRTFPLTLAGGKSGPSIVPGSAKDSLLFRKFPDLFRHPPENSRPTAAHLATLRTWIDAGAPADDHGGPVSAEDSPPLKPADRARWAYQTPVRPPTPKVSTSTGAHTPIDAFLLDELGKKGLGFSPPADRGTLIRRLSFDLVGLPPTPEDVDAFVQDTAPDAFERLVERLLASPHYGERWGRHWLDAAGYVNARGTDNDAGIIEPLENIWKYRDYVVSSFNEDVPHDRFLTEQLAGDEQCDWQTAQRYSACDRRLLTATGFMRLAADVTYATELNTSDIRHQVLFDTVQILSSNLLGITVHCAQCHTHKFDPISHADYYRFAGLLTPAYDPHHWLHSKERTLTDVPPATKTAIDAENASITRQIAGLNAELEQLKRSAGANVVALSGGAKTAKTTTGASGPKPAEKTPVAVHPVSAKATGAGAASVKDRERTLRDSIAALAKKRRTYGVIQALWDLGDAPPVYIYQRGDFRKPGPRIDAGVVAVLDDPQHPFQLPKPRGAGRSTGYRTAFAKWLTSPRHPLTARVYANRVWEHHFGRGIVATPENFGVSGLPPSNPRLLDWLAREFVDSGWSVKHLHRLIVTSAAYRQSSQSADPAAQTVAHVDPDNVLLWKMPLRRHESEIVRDAILATSGSLEPRMEGAPVPLKPNPDGSVEIDQGKLTRPADAFRRSVYLFARRNYQLTELGPFDQPVVATNCTCRTSSAVVSQSLILLNGRFALEQARTFAERVGRIAGADDSARVTTAFRFALGRTPTSEERRLSLAMLSEQTDRHQTPSLHKPSDPKSDERPADAALADLCQMLMNTNEFLYAP